jgi:hypothetical protein
MKTLFLSAILLVANHCRAQKQGETLNTIYLMYVNEAYKPHTFSKLLIISRSYVLKTDRDIQELFTKQGIQVISGVDKLPPFKEYSDEEINEIARKNGADGIVRVTTKGQLLGGSSGDFVVENLQLTLVDLTSDLDAATFVGKASAYGLKNDSQIYIFFKAVMADLNPLLGVTIRK